MPLYLFYTIVQKSQKWPKIQIKGGGGGGPALNQCLAVFLPLHVTSWHALCHACIQGRRRGGWFVE